MRITRVHVRLAVSPADRPELQATCSMDLDDLITIKDVEVVARRDGSLFVAMPSCRFFGKPTKAGVRTYFDHHGEPYHYRDVVAIASQAARTEIESIVIPAFRDVARSGEFEGLVPIPAPSLSIGRAG
jgi:DNA-binding cell septation regulator SpoVG